MSLLYKSTTNRNFIIRVITFASAEYIIMKNVGNCGVSHRLDGSILEGWSSIFFSPGSISYKNDLGVVPEFRTSKPRIPARSQLKDLLSDRLRVFAGRS